MVVVARPADFAVNLFVATHSHLGGIPIARGQHSSWRRFLTVALDRKAFSLRGISQRGGIVVSSLLLCCGWQLKPSGRAPIDGSMGLAQAAGSHGQVIDHVTMGGLHLSGLLPA